MPTLYEEIVDAMGELHGVHPGFRAAHAKGTFCTGSFTPTPEARELSRAAHLRGDPVAVSVRFSNGSGDPGASDADRRDGRGMATKFRLPGGDETDIVAITIPVFFVRTAQDFLEFVRARKPDPETGEMDLEKVGVFLAEHPETQAALELILPTLVLPVSYATCAYNSLHAFGFVNESGERRFGRYRWEPEAGIRNLSDEEIESAGRDYLQDELTERIGNGPARFKLSVTLAEESDPLQDPTVAWPEDRSAIMLGTMELTALDTESESRGDVVVFDPSRVTDGIECTDDEILAARPHAYSVSIERRMAAART